MKLRVRFNKLGKIRWISHRDIARCVERAVRRANLPVAYSEGFSPRPRISFGLALPTGAESLAEYLDIDFADNEVNLADVGPSLSTGLPVGIDVTATAPLPGGADSLQESVVSCRWEVGIFSAGHAPLDAEWFADAVNRVTNASELVVTRERKGAVVTDDIRPGITALSEGARPDGTPILIADLATGVGRSIRPTELGLALELPVARLDVRRTHQWIERDGGRVEPLLETSNECLNLPLTSTSRSPGDAGAVPVAPALLTAR